MKYLFYFKQLLEKIEMGNNYIFEKNYSEKIRKKYAKQGIALPDGSYPIKTKKDLENACKWFKMLKAKNSTYDLDGTIKKHILKRAKTIKNSDEILKSCNLK